MATTGLRKTVAICITISLVGLYASVLIVDAIHGTAKKDGIPICIALVFIAIFASIAVTENAKEKTEQYRIQYNCPTN